MKSEEISKNTPMLYMEYCLWVFYAIDKAICQILNKNCVFWMHYEYFHFHLPSVVKIWSLGGCGLGGNGGPWDLRCKKSADKACVEGGRPKM